jgi:hypothetical protein
MEAISMKCTRDQYESMRQELLLGKIKESNFLFDFYGQPNVYLTNDFGNELIFSCTLFDRKVYETFDKDVFLKACGIQVNKDEKTSMLETVINLIEDLDIKVINTEYGDGTFKMTIKGNTK